MGPSLELVDKFRYCGVVEERRTYGRMCQFLLTSEPKPEIKNKNLKIQHLKIHPENKALFLLLKTEKTLKPLLKTGEDYYAVLI